jgi:transposase
MRHDLTDYEWAAFKPFLPNKPRGVPRVNGRRVLNGIFWVLRSGAPWRDLPAQPLHRLQLCLVRESLMRPSKETISTVSLQHSRR